MVSNRDVYFGMKFHYSAIYEGFFNSFRKTKANIQKWHCGLVLNTVGLKMHFKLFESIK